jgi:hypothetical protein
LRLIIGPNRQLHAIGGAVLKEDGLGVGCARRQFSSRQLRGECERKAIGVVPVFVRAWRQPAQDDRQAYKDTQYQNAGGNFSNLRGVLHIQNNNTPRPPASGTVIIAASSTPPTSLAVSDIKNSVV